jgi:hypothetical protein
VSGPGGRVASEQEAAISRPVRWTATGLMVSLEEWKPTTSSKSGFAASGRLPHASASPRNAWTTPSASGSGPSSKPISRGWSVRQIATATGLSSSRVHQLLGSDEARAIPRWLSQQRRRGRPGQPDVPARLADELEALRRCHEWLERLDSGERVVVNLRPETDPETEYVAFDRPRVLRVLARIIADLDELAGYPPSAAEGRTEGKTAEARRAHHRRRLAEPDPPPKRLTVQEERAALWDALGHPASQRRR